MMSMSAAQYRGCAEFWMPMLLLSGVAARLTWCYSLVVVLLISLLLLSNVFDFAKYS